MNTETATDQPITLIYNDDGFAWVRNTGGQSGALVTKDNPKAKYSTLMAAFIAAVRLGYNPTRWQSPSGYPMRIDQADHWRTCA